MGYHIHFVKYGIRRNVCNTGPDWKAIFQIRDFDIHFLELTWTKFNYEKLMNYLRKLYYLYSIQYSYLLFCTCMNVC